MILAYSVKNNDYSKKFIKETDERLKSQQLLLGSMKQINGFAFIHIDPLLPFRGWWVGVPGVVLLTFIFGVSSWLFLPFGIWSLDFFRSKIFLNWMFNKSLKKYSVIKYFKRVDSDLALRKAGVFK